MRRLMPRILAASGSESFRSRSAAQRAFAGGCLLVAVTILLLLPARGNAQTGPHVLMGDVKVDESKTGRQTSPLTFRIILYSLSGNVIDSQMVTNNGRYRFSVSNGRYDVAIEHENFEIGRIRVSINSAFRTDFREDIALELKPDFFERDRSKAATVSVEDLYERRPATKAMFDDASQEISQKNYPKALELLHRLLSIDPADFQAWTETGTVYMLQKDYAEADKAYTKAIEARPTFFLALMNLGRLRMSQKNFDGAITVLTQALAVKPQSSEANFNLGEAYLQIKKGSKAVGYLNEALKLDPIKMAEAHLLLAALYNGAGLKDKAVAEYEQFLKKKPDYPERKKLEHYIAENKKP
jgi:tetratricopeptide (TPR) repeat protein